MSVAADHLEADFCIVGAGFAGLTAALRLTQAGYSVFVLEARERVGGKVWTHYLDDGTPVDMGGTFLGPTQDRIYALLDEFDLSITPTPNHGDSLIVYDNQVYRYSDDMPDLDASKLAGVWETLRTLSKMSAEVSNQSPWSGPRAKEWDSITLAQFIDAPSRNLSEPARAMLRALFISLFTCELSEISLLFVLFQIAAAGNDIEIQMRVEGGADQDMVKGGMSLVALKMVEKLGDCIIFSSPVTRIEQNEKCATVFSSHVVVKAKQVVVAVPPNLAGAIEYSPSLPATKTELLRHMPAGRCIKFITAYETPFWREEGLSGEVMAPDEFIQMTLDASAPDKESGLLMSFAFAREAILLQEMPPQLRKDTLLNELEKRFGPKAQKPLQYFEHDWFQDRWTQGCHVAHTGAGVITSFGHVIREPFGRIYWATSETSTLWNGNIDGAVRAGEYAAREILAIETI
ncbi:MAG: monoamine oxidase [Cyanobacteria bacterium PR.3.49]|nr:monoamine oxidase [Cyanobacteria bacterium PR.3.49]